MVRLIRLMMVLATGALLVAACGDDDDTVANEPTSETTSAQDEPADGDAAGGGGASVTIVDFAFDPQTIEVAAGSAITWTNEDGVAHTVTAGEPGAAAGSFDETVDAGATTEITFDEAGTFPYFCSIHPTMTAEVVVA